MNILVAIDGSACSELAIESITKRKYKNADKFFVLGVVQPIPKDLGFGDKELAEKEYKKRMTPVIESFTKVTSEAKEKILASHPDNQVEARVETGLVVDTIIDIAKSQEIDLIILGSHGRKGFDHFLLGSVAETVLVKSPCSVEVVKMFAG